jgi:hypothetical protein
MSLFNFDQKTDSICLETMQYVGKKLLVMIMNIG